ncbi:hypothetical protein HHL17_10665 [Chitinophaga sp. G-6-1-13]|uniref:MoxR-vWA-beta-propeller ternary system domain-containing protein n=1 Tax=Chitinophaga fulva TaxID=2728842 RepID=A0A848GGS2_9BACT|nr:hypothetical protein [Chitinophaga fulva]NML37654.1 hypothetical protein [Chitinophaga fulva]
MKLTLGLQYHDAAPTTNIAAAFVYGRHAGEWLDAISRWQLPMEQLKALPVPQRDSAATAGLLVLFNGAVPPFPELLQYPYQQLDNLFIPVNAVLTPALTTGERKKLLIWDQQILHPVLGFTGFHHDQLIPLSSLLTFSPPLPADWEHARMGTLPAPSLKRVLLEAVATDTIFLDIQQEIGHQPLEDIIPTPAKTKRPSFFSKLLRLLTMVSPFRTTKSPSSDQLRQQALQRLTDLFDTDYNKALEYAIPLDSPYAPRGMSLDSGTSLGRRDTNFSLGNLGGGGPVSYWNVGDFQQSLREKYLEAAKKAIAAGDYRKAAYIYAHLLGDYNMAANVLEKGGFYREAAALYLDHLKNHKAAAAALEKGGFLEEAVDIYISIEMHEKAGDLYILLHQHDLAMLEYQCMIDLALKHGNYQFAARIAREKMHDNTLAGQLLLTSWEKKIDPQQSLKQYFDLQTNHLQQAIQTVYRDHMPAGHETDLLMVLKDVTVQHPETAIRDTGLDITYEIVNKRLQRHDDSLLAYLRYFIPDDKLLQKDINHYTGHKQAAPVTMRPLQVLQFAKDVKWLSGTRLPQQMLFTGFSENGVYLLDFDMGKKWYYHLWKMGILHPLLITMIFQPNSANRVLLLGDFPSLQAKGLAAPETEDRLTIEMPSWLPQNLFGVSITEQFIITLYSANGVLVFRDYTSSGTAGNPKECRLEGKPFLLQQPYGKIQEVFFHQGFFYFFNRTDILRCAWDGQLEAFPMGAEILHMSATTALYGITLAVATVQGVVIVQFGGKLLSAKSGYITSSATRDIILSWLPHNRLAIGDRLKVAIYKVSGSQVTTTYVAQYTTAATVRALLPMPQPHCIGILDEEGQFSICDLPA